VIEALIKKADALILLAGPHQDAVIQAVWLLLSSGGRLF